MTTFTTYHYPDPILAKETRRSLLTLFTIGCFLTLPAGLVFVVAASSFENGLSHVSAGNAAMLLTAAIPSSIGILAWAALGLLLTKPAYPRWHRIAWSLVLLFAISALPACFYWFVAVEEAEFIFPILIFVVAAASCCIPIALRNLDLARSSLLRSLVVMNDGTTDDR